MEEDEVEEESESEVEEDEELVKKVRINQEKNAMMMKRKTCLKLRKTTKTFKLHEKCTITVEKGVRQGIQSQRIPAIIH